MLPIVTRDAIVEFVHAHAATGVGGVAKYEAQLPAYRSTIGGLIGANGDEIALLRNTGDGATILAQGLDLGAGDEILTNRNEFGSNAYPWLALEHRGVKVRFIDAPCQRMTPDTLARAITPRTKVVAVSWVTFDDGYRHDLAALAEVAHAHGAWFFVDAIQGLGAFPLDVRACNIDALYASGAKWLMAVQGVSFLYLAREHHDRIATRLASWRSVADMWNFLDYDQPWAPNASRYEAGTPNILGACALATSIGVLESAGIEAISDRVLALTDRLVAGLRSRGCEIASVRTANERSGIVLFTHPTVAPLVLGKRLADAGIVTTNRSSGIRVSPHGYTAFDEIDALLDLLPAP